MNAREGIKTSAPERFAPDRSALKTMNAREGIKTLRRKPGGGLPDAGLKTMNAREGIKTKTWFLYTPLNAALKTMNAREGIKTFKNSSRFIFILIC